MTVYNVFFVYRDGDSYLTASFLGSYESLDGACSLAWSDDTRGENKKRDVHVKDSPRRVSSDWIESNTDACDGDYLILMTRVMP
jgi:hypothetical protein